jgi:hypothetical protein
MKKIILTLICFIVLFTSCKEYNESQDTFESAEISSSEYDENDVVNSNQTDNYSVTNEQHNLDEPSGAKPVNTPVETKKSFIEQSNEVLLEVQGALQTPSNATMNQVKIDKKDYEDYIDTQFITNVEAANKARAHNQKTLEKVAKKIIDKKN